MERRSRPDRHATVADSEVGLAHARARRALVELERVLDVQRAAFAAERWTDAPADLRDRYPDEHDGRVSTEAMQRWWSYLAHRRIWSHRCAWTLARATRAARHGDLATAHRLIAEAFERARAGSAELSATADDLSSDLGSRPMSDPPP